MDNDVLGIVAKTALFYIPFLFALCMHEFAHGWMAQKLGDNTAKFMGRLTLNPLAHADFLGTFLLPIISVMTGSSIFFGWAKPVPVNEKNFKDRKRDMFWVAFAGPLSNILMAFVSSFLLVFVFLHLKEAKFYKAALALLQTFMQINLALAMFNLIPIHPLDGAKVLARFLPESINQKLEEHQNMLSLFLMVLFISGAMSFLRLPLMWSYNLLLTIAEKVLV